MFFFQYMHLSLPNLKQRLKSFSSPPLTLSIFLSLNLKCQNHEQREIIYLGALSHKMIKKIPRVEKNF